MSKTWELLHRTERASPANARILSAADMTTPEIPDDWSTGPQPAKKAAEHAADHAETSRWIDSVPEVRASDLSRVVGHAAATGPAAERFRLLRVRLRNLRAMAPLKTLLITSALPQDGKTTVAINLATMLTEQRAKRVLLIDFDLHRKSVSEQLGLLDTAGVTNCLHEGLPPTSAVRRVEPLGVFALGGGTSVVETPAEMMSSARMGQLLAALTPAFDWVVIDSPPVLPVTDALSLLPSVDGALLVARAGKTPARALDEAIALVGRKSVLGVVLNGTDDPGKGYYGYSNYYKSSR